MTDREKRRHARIVSLNLSYVCLDKQGEPLLESMGRTLNVSKSGICLETHFAIDSSIILLLSIALENELVDVRGRVVYCKHKEGDLYETGVEFMEMDAKTQEVVDEFVTYFLENQNKYPVSLD